ncbi:MAG: hypothetical protein AAFN92_23630, partial [Bacteroidota bacterium]
MPDAIRGLFILLCFAFILWYYVLYPRRVAARPRFREDLPDRQRPETPAAITARKIRTTGDNLSATFRVLRRNGRWLLGGLFLTAGVFCLLSFGFYGAEPATRYYFQSTPWSGFEGTWIADFMNIHELFTSFGRDRGLLYLLLSALGLYALFRLGFTLFWQAASTQLLAASWRSEAFLYLVCLAVAFAFAFGGTVAALFAFLALPFCFVFAYAGYAGLASFRETFRYVYTNLAASYGAYLLLLTMALPVMWLLDTAIGGLLFAFLDWVVYADAVQLDNLNV